MIAATAADRLADEDDYDGAPGTGLPEVARMNEQMALIGLLRHALELQLAASERPSASPI